MIDAELEGKIVLITGANHGIGAATAIAFAKQKAKIFATYLRINNNERNDTPDYKNNQAKDANEVIGQIRSLDGVVKSLEADLSDVSKIPLLFDTAEKTVGPIDVLVNNAAYCVPDTFEFNKNTVEESTGMLSSIFSSSSHDEHFAINSRAVALMMKEFATRCVKRNASWGRIINISTDAADCFPTEISYGASKAALESFSRSAAVELGKYGITVNIVAPGPIQTGWMTKEVEELQAKRSPLKRIGRPNDVADVIVFLASNQARWITGQKLYVGGGNRVT
jgi:3-oxoacyl-[acyl-carrier protein] reductase